MLLNENIVTSTLFALMEDKQDGKELLQRVYYSNYAKKIL